MVFVEEFSFFFDEFKEQLTKHFDLGNMS